MKSIEHNIGQQTTIHSNAVYQSFAMYVYNVRKKLIAANIKMSNRKILKDNISVFSGCNVIRERNKICLNNQQRPYIAQQQGRTH